MNVMKHHYHGCPLGDECTCQAVDDMNQEDQTEPCPPLRVAYSLEEIRRKLTQWMLEEYGSPRDIEDHDERDKWYERNGMIHHFLASHFPDENGRFFGENTHSPAPETPTTNQP